METLFWPLFLAHLIADYPLQTETMVRVKKELAGLAFHVALHLVTMLILLFGLLGTELTPVIWGVLAVSLSHFGIDFWKSVCSKRWPTWIIGGYLQDQALHLVSIVAVAYWLAWANEESSFAVTLAAKLPWIVHACGFILVTHAWFITERILFYRDREYRQWVSMQMWPRLISRAVLFCAMLLGWNFWGAVSAIGALGFHLSDLTCSHRRRAVLIDVGVVVSVALCVLWLR